MAKEITVRVVHDFACPWCYIGQKNLQSISQAWSDKYDVKVEFAPYFLNKDIPRENGFTVEEYFEAKGRSKEDVEAYLNKSPAEKRRSTLFQMGQDADIFFPAEVSRDKRIYHSGKVHLLEKYAAEKMDSTKLWQLVNDIYSAYHINNSNIDSDEFLLSITNKYELPKEEVLEAISNEKELQNTYKEADRNKEVEVGVPQFYFHVDGNVVHQISGAQDTRTLLKALKVASEK